MSIIVHLGGTGLVPNNRRPIDYGYGRLFRVQIENSMRRQESNRLQKYQYREALVEIMKNTEESIIEFESLSQRALHLNSDLSDQFHEKALKMSGFYIFLKRIIKAVDDNKLTISALREELVPIVKNLERFMKFQLGI